MFNEVCELMVGVFEHIGITYKLGIDKTANYTEPILTGPALKKYCASFLDCKWTERGFLGRQWNFGSTRDIIIQYFGVWDKQYGLDMDGDEVCGEYHCEIFKQELWFDIGKPCG